jgi:hypothetical protein
VALAFVAKIVILVIAVVIAIAILRSAYPKASKRD